MDCKLALSREQIPGELHFYEQMYLSLRGSSSGAEVAAVITHEDDPNEVRWYDSVKELAEAHGIPTITPKDPNTPEVLAWGRERQPDVIFSFYYRLMLKAPWLTLAPLGAFNLHGSLLPKFRGRACVNWALVEGATETGVTLHEMVEKADAGKLLGQERVPILDYENARQVFEKLVPAARRLLTKLVPLIEKGQASRTPQTEADATYFGGRKPDDGRIDWHWPARRIHNLVRAVAPPYPGAFALVNGKKLYIWKGRVLSDGDVKGVPGQMLPATSEGVPVITGEGVYLVQGAQWEGAGEPDVRENVLKMSTKEVTL